VKFIRPSFYILCVLFAASSAQAQSFCPLEEPRHDPKAVASLAEFQKIPILHEGRIKPLDTYARNLLLQFSGRTTFERKPAIDWLARLVFSTASTKDDKIFLINNPAIPMAAGIKPEKRRRYSFTQLNTGIPKIIELAQVADAIEEKNRSIVEQEVLRVYNNIVLYTQFSYEYTFTFPHADFFIADTDIIEELGLPEDQKGQFSFIDIALNAGALRAITSQMTSGSPQMWREKEKKLFFLIGNLFQWSQSNSNLPWHVVPSIDSDDESWMSAWDATNREFYDERVRNEVDLLRDLNVHYWNGEQLLFDFAARGFMDSVYKRLPSSEQTQVKKIPLEIIYNKANFFLWAKFFYILAFFVFLLSLCSTHLPWHTIAFGLIVGGFVPHTIALIMRIIIMARPPVSNLYETFIFVGFVAVLLGIIIELVHKKWLGIVVSSIGGIVLLLISAKYSAEGDTMRMLVAVLNSNFWLGTHVLSITIGYAGCCVAGIVGHMYIIQKLIYPKDKKLLEATYHNLVGTLGFGLMMTFLGTMLGGIWADQSWGRFWGWDPKENGALLIVIWCAIVFHAKIAKIIGPLGMAVGCVLGIIVVMWAWFGVNLLSIGLHSYGFTSGIANGLMIYVVCEVIFLLVSLAIIKKQK